MIDFRKLKDIREDNDLNQEEMANILHVKRARYSLWKLGINIIPLKNLCDYADYFNYNIDYILGLTQNKEASKVLGIDFQILGKNMKDIRIKHKLSQRAIANILGVTQACIVRYEQGIIAISTSNLYKFSKEFNVSLSELCGKNKTDLKVKINN